jgi:RecB family endonuclease NucS
MYQKDEYDVHYLIRNFPYILGKEYNQLKLKHEKVYDDRTRSDFVFSNDHISIVVEVKKGAIDISMINQATHYLDNEKKENLTKILKGVLVGTLLKDSVTQRLCDSDYPFEIKLLGIDIPIEVKLCDKCRKANATISTTCVYCGSKKFIVDPFLF